MLTVNLNINDLPEKKRKNLFPHQYEALEKLSYTFDNKDSQGKAGLLVIPTGGGKTFTAAKWLADNALAQNMKVIWLAHTFHLLDQAYDAFYEVAGELVGRRETLNIRCISSHPSHWKVSTVQPSDDVLIMSTPTAISAYTDELENNDGTKQSTAFKNFIMDHKKSRIVIVLDEAHHAPASGCRNLLMELKKQIPNIWLLGLTATPTYSDETRRGWLGKIFENGIIYSVKKDTLQMQNILAREKYLQLTTPLEHEVDDALFERLVRQHKDLPDYIIEGLAKNDERNDFIIQEYVSKRDEYGKTIMFVDRWYQCEYIKDKLSSRGILVDAVYSMSGNEGRTSDERNVNRNEYNKQVIKKFKCNELEVLLNVKMLTEGTDVPDTKTVFITRDTTSNILLTQMIGRALRGEKAGGVGKKEANIVFFSDTWKRMINWAIPGLAGGMEESQTTVKRYPMELISLALVKRLSEQINSGIVFNEQPFVKYLPVGWYEVEMILDISEDTNEEMQSFKEYVLVYDHTVNKFQALIDSFDIKEKKDWGKEKLDNGWILDNVHPYIDRYFNIDEDDIDNSLYSGVASILRHIAQNDIKPKFIAFDCREEYDIDKLAKRCLEMNPRQTNEELKQIYYSNGTQWKNFYKSYDRFRTAVQGSINRLIEIDENGYDDTQAIPMEDDKAEGFRELSETDKAFIRNRDNNQCVCCKLSKSEIRLEIDHIRPFSFGGASSTENSQLLCRACNHFKGGKKVIDFRQNASQLRISGEFEAVPIEANWLKDFNKIRAVLFRAVNFFYKSNAIYDVKMSQRRNGNYYDRWLIILNPGNDPLWLINKKHLLLRFIMNDLKQLQVLDIDIKCLDNI